MRALPVLVLLIALPAWGGDLTQRLLAGEAPPPPDREAASPGVYDPDRPAVSRRFDPRGLGLEEEDARRFQAALEAYFFRDYASAARLWRPLAEKGHPRSQAQLGWLHQLGLGVRRDLVAARQWYERAARGGDAVAQNNLAALLEHGEGGGQDLVQARRWYGEAAEQGYAPAQYNLARLLEAGLGGPQDAATARRWLARAAAAGLPQARAALGGKDPRTAGGMGASPPAPQ